MERRSFLLVGIFAFICSAVQVGAVTNMEMVFEAKYEAWRAVRSGPLGYGSSRRGGEHITCRAFREIEQLGPAALPCIIKKMESDPEAYLLWHAVEAIARVRFRRIYDRANRANSYPDYPELKRGELIWVHWWKDGRRRTPQMLDELYRRWKELDSASNHDAAKEIHERIKGLGLSALPLLMAKIRNGDESVIKTVFEIIGEQQPAGKEECLDWWEKNKDKLTLPPVEDER